MYKLNFNVSGIHCDACIKLITMKVKKIEGAAEFSLTKEGKAELSANREVRLDEIKRALEGLEYTVTP